MSMEPKPFDLRQDMLGSEFELQYKRDHGLKNVALHHHDFYEIYYLISGDVTYTIDSRICRVMPGDILIIGPKELHQVYIRSEVSAYERFVLWVNPQVIQSLSTANSDLLRALDPEKPNSVRQLRLRAQDQKLVIALLQSLFAEFHQESYGADLQCRSLLVQLLVHINRLAAQDGDYYEAFSSSSLFISQVIDYINHHYSEDLSLDQLAELFFVSKYHLSHEFNRQVGTSLYRYIQKKRLQIARQLLAQGKKPYQLYSECGFSEYAGFYRAFRAEYGQNPRYYMPPPEQGKGKKRRSQNIGSENNTPAEP